MHKFSLCSLDHKNKRTYGHNALHDYCFWIFQGLLP